MKRSISSCSPSKGSGSFIMIGLADRKAGVHRCPSLQLVHFLEAPIWAVMGLSNNLGLGGRQVPQAFLVARRAVASLRHRCAGTGSHPEGEPPVGSIDLSCLGAVVERAPARARCFPTDLPPPPFLLLLLLLR